MTIRQERHKYFENLMQKLGITKAKRKAYIEFLIKQKKSDKWLNQKLDIEVLEELRREEEERENEKTNK